MSDTAHLEQESAPEPVVLHGCPLVTAFGQQVLFVPREQYSKVMKALLADGYEMCADLTAVDYLQHPGRTVPAGVTAERFELVVNLVSLTARARLRAWSCAAAAWRRGVAARRQPQERGPFGSRRAAAGPSPRAWVARLALWVPE